MKEVFLVFVIIAGLLLAIIFGLDPLVKAQRAPLIAACEAKGGVYIPQYKSRDLCLRKDVVLR